MLWACQLSRREPSLNAFEDDSSTEMTGAADMGSAYARLLLIALPLIVSLIPACQQFQPFVVAESGSPPPVVRVDDSKWRPFGPFARLADPAGPAARQPDLVVPGSGQYLGLAQAVRSTPAASRDQTFTINLVNASIAEAARAILGDIFGVNYTVDPKIEARVTVQTSKPVDRAGIAELFEAALRSHGVVIVQTGEVFRVVTADQAGMGARLSTNSGSRPLIGNSVKIVPLRYISPTEMKRILDPLAAFGGVIRVDESRNAIVLSGNEQEITSMEEAIAIFDVDIMKGMSFALVPVRAVEPDAIVDNLNQIFASNREGPMNGMVQFIPNKRLKSILIISKQPHYLAQARQWVHRLDARAIGTERQFFTYMLRNRQAKEVLDVLLSAFAAETAVGEPQGARADVAPRFRRSSVESGTTAPPAEATTTLNQALLQHSFNAFGVNPGTGSPQRTTVTSEAQERGVSSGSIAPEPDGEPRIKIVADIPNNSLIVRATLADYKRVERVIANLDVVPNQVLIEATICEVTLTDDLKFGVRWFFQAKGGRSTSIFSSALDGALNSVFPGFSWVYKAASTQVTLNALNSVANVNVLASPALMVLDGRTASLQIGDQVPITTQTATSVITPGAPIVNSVSYRDTGVILAVTPRINEAGRVMLEIEQEVSNVSTTTTSSIDSPTFGRRRVKTTVLVKDGEALTLGGLIQDKKSFRAAQVPILGNIPVIGNAFKDKDDSVEKTELIILLTPRVVRDVSEAQLATDEYRRRVETFVPRRGHPARQLEHDIRRTFE